MNKVLSDNGLDYIDSPFLDYKVKNPPDSAIGCYMNYLEVGSLIIIPIFKVERNKDEEPVKQ